MLRIIGAAALAAVVTSGVPALAQCITPATVERSLTESRVAETIHRYQGRDARILTDAYNEIPPESEHRTDLVLVVPIRGFGFERIFLFNDGCMVQWLDLERGWAVRQLGDGV